MVDRRRNCSSPFPQYFQHIFLTKELKLHVHLSGQFIRFVFSSILQACYVEVRISRSVSEGPFDFEITRVDCIYFLLKGNNFRDFMFASLGDKALSKEVHSHW